MLQRTVTRNATRTEALLEGRLVPLGDTAVVISLGDKIDEETHERVKALGDLLETSPPQGMIEYIPAFTTVTVIYDPLQITYEALGRRLSNLLEKKSRPRGAERDDRVVEIPVCYGGDLGPDLEFVASHTKLPERDVIRIHGEPEYVVYMIGFAPGFPYLGGMSELIAAPRLESPRERIPPGSVGIAGDQTGVYPIESPGGWRLIGRTPLTLFRPEDAEPSLLRTGDRVRFMSIGRHEYDDLLERDEA
jgi:inhibitor of KinA